ncbi:hypothetical protein [Nocardia brevicatena]|nr:hypothetical protein [Nocardia brevicatena]
MSERHDSDQPENRYDPEQDPDADPEMLQPERVRPQPDQAEGEEEPDQG